MTAQEIDDVRGRAYRPELELAAVLPPGQSTTTGDSSGSVHELGIQFRARNVSMATATYVVTTVAFIGDDMGLSFVSNPEWQHLESDVRLKIARSAVASGNSSRWSPIGPGYTFAFQQLTLKLRAYQQEDRKPAGRRHIGYVRLDHDGGTRLYSMRFWIPSSYSIELEDVTEPNADYLPELLRTI
ncbi:MAG TPA: hypothetical protein VK009_14060 [Chloroflexota bacterium]|nr:hypothetical protein [Chloroflexota bacterium]